MHDRTCTVPDCVKPLRDGANAVYCGMHYHRLYRHGSLERTAHAASAPRVRKPRRYESVYLPSHPVASRNGHAWLHRVILFDHLGTGSHPCHWCGKPLTWRNPDRAQAIYVDHLDGDTANNDLGNLAPSCNGCNAGRGCQERSAKLREAGWWSNHDTIDALGTRRETIES